MPVLMVVQNFLRVSLLIVLVESYCLLVQGVIELKEKIKTIFMAQEERIRYTELPADELETITKASPKIDELQRRRSLIARVVSEYRRFIIMPDDNEGNEIDAGQGNVRAKRFPDVGSKQKSLDTPRVDALLALIQSKINE